MSSTKIEWATHVWNPFTGCDRVSPGCAHCYAATQAARNQRWERGRAAKARREGKPEPALRYQNDGDPKSSGPGFGFTVHWDKLEKGAGNFPAGARVFVNSMSDVFHEEAPREAIVKLFGTFAEAQEKGVDFLVLTKRPKEKEVASSLKAETVIEREIARYEARKTKAQETVEECEEQAKRLKLALTALTNGHAE